MTRSFCAQDTDGSAHRHTCCERKQDPSTLRFIPKGLLNLNNMEFIWITYGYGPFGSLMSTTSYHKFFQTPPAVTSQKKKTNLNFTSPKGPQAPQGPTHLLPLQWLLQNSRVEVQHHRSNRSTNFHLHNHCNRLRLFTQRNDGRYVFCFSGG